MPLSRDDPLCCTNMYESPVPLAISADLGSVYDVHAE